jgi:hypothetical protein
MLPVGRTRYIDFALVDVDGDPITGRTVSSFVQAPNKLIFLRNTLPCQDVLTLKDYEDGRYTLSYLPSAAGHDYVQIYDSETDISVIDVEDVVPMDFAFGGAAALYAIDHNFGGADALRMLVESPQDWTLYVYQTDDWDYNRRGEDDAAGVTSLDENGRWKLQLSVQAGNYNIVLRKFREVKLVKIKLEVGG